MSLARGGWRRLGTALLLGAAFVFLYRAAAANWQDLREFEWRIRGGMLAASILAHVGVLAWGVFLWSRVLRCFGPPPVGFPGLLRVWSLSNAARYIPGAIWQFLAAAQLSRELGLPGVLALTSMIVHVAFSLLSAVTISAAMLPLSALGLGGGGSEWARGAVLVLAGLLVHPALLNAGLRLVPRALHRSVLLWRGSWADGLVLLALANLSWILYGAAYALFVASLAPLPAGAYLTLTAVNALSFTAGYLAVLAPGGLGVRESAMALLLAPLLPAGVAAVIAVAARLWSVAAEVLLAAGAVLLARARGGGPRG